MITKYITLMILSFSKVWYVFIAVIRNINWTTFDNAKEEKYLKTLEFFGWRQSLMSIACTIISIQYMHNKRLKNILTLKYPREQSFSWFICGIFQIITFIAPQNFFTITQNIKSKVKETSSSIHEPMLTGIFCKISTLFVFISYT